MSGITEREVLDVLWQNSVIGLALVAEDGRFLRANPAFCDFVEFSETELLRRTFIDVTHPEDVADDRQMAADVAAGRATTYNMRKRYIAKRSGLAWALLRVVPLHDGDGRFVAFLSQVAPEGQEKDMGSAPARKPARIPWDAIKGALPILASLGAALGAALVYFFEHTGKK